MKTKFTASDYLEDVVRDMTDIDLKSACRTLLHDQEFKLWPAAIGMHHAYPGGLMEHTAEVLEYALASAASFSGKVDLDVLVAACLWHDAAKILEYEVVILKGTHDAPENSLVKRRHGDSFGETEYWRKSDYIKRVGHIAGSTNFFYHTAMTRGVRQQTIEAVCHAILAHHGPVLEWGSPVAPQTIEAFLLHHADMLSARFGATKEKS